MKTFNPFNIKNASYILSVALSLFVISCGSYTNSSYYDSDGIYSDSSSKRYNYEETVVNQENQAQNNKTGSYFTQFQSYDVIEDEPVGIFTDVESYYGDGSYSSGYSGWGNNTSDVTVNVYGGLGWGGWYGGYWGWGSPYWSIGWGLNSWYYPYWSWNYGWGWGWSSWYNPYWGYYYPRYYPYYGGYYYYNGGPRSRYYSDYSSRYRTSNVYSGRGTSRAYEVRSRSQATGATRSNSRFTTDASRINNAGTTRNVNSTRNSTIDYNQSRNNRNSTINNNSRNSDIYQSAPTRNNTIQQDRGRSSSPSMGRGSSMGGSRSSGTSGGSRSSSSGGGRRR